MNLWSSIRRMWAKHDEHLAEREVEGEASGAALEDFSEKAAYMNRVDQVEPLENGVEPE